MSERGSGEFFKGLLIGGAIGAVFALLYAPKSGEETREELGGKVDDLKSKGRNEFEAAQGRVKEKYQSALERLEDLESLVMGRAQDVENIVGEVAKEGPDMLKRNRKRLKEAIDAARDAFQEEKNLIASKLKKKGGDPESPNGVHEEDLPDIEDGEDGDAPEKE